MAGDMIWEAAGAEEATSGCDTGGGCREAKGPKVRVAGSDRRRRRQRRLRLRLRLQLRLKVEGAGVEDRGSRIECVSAWGMPQVRDVRRGGRSRTSYPEDRGCRCRQELRVTAKKINGVSSGVGEKVKSVWAKGYGTVQTV